MEEAVIRANMDTPPLKLLQRRRETPWIRRMLVFFACVVLLDGLFGDQGLGHTMRARRDYERAVGDLRRMKMENAALRDEIGRLHADPARIEAIAREELGLIRAGEIVVLVKDAK